LPETMEALTGVNLVDALKNLPGIGAAEPKDE
jgi:hypothetical protein